MNSNPSTNPADDIFVTTQWTVVLAAGKRHTPQSDLALDQLCQVYWFPLYAYVRRRGHSKEDAEDLTQAFFERFLSRNYLADLSAEHGRFRAFMLVSLKHFLANEWDKTRCLKRGGGQIHLSLDWQTADSHFQIADAREASPDKVFDREWAVALLARVIDRLHAECEADGRGALFLELRPVLTAGKGAIPYSEPAKRLGMAEGAIRTAAHRLRKRYRELLRHEIAQTLTDPAQVDEEMRALFGAFGK